MLKKILVTSFAFVLSTALAAEAAPKEDALAAAKKLADAKNYSWKATIEGGGVGAQEGKTEKDGFTTLSFTVRDNTLEAVRKGEKGAVKLQNEWKTFEEASQPAEEGQPNRGRFIVAMMRNLRLPATLAQELTARMKEVQKTDEGWSGELTEDGAKELLAFRGRGNNAPPITNAKANAKLFAKDGVINKIVYQVQATVTVNNEERDINRTTTIEITDIDSTKVEVPEDAKKKIS